MHNKNWTRRAALALTLSLVAAGPVLAQSRIIRIVVPFGPGAVQDTIARTFNNELGLVLGATVIVENRAGAGGTIGTAMVAKAVPDGNTLVLAAASHTIAGHLYAKLPYDPIKDFVGVSYLGTSGYAIAVPGGLGVNTLAEYVKLLKSKPGQLNYASAGSGSATHMGMAYFLAKAGVPGYKFDSWIGLLAPAGTPKAEVDRINAAVIKVMADSVVQERFTRLGVEAGTSSADDFQKLLRADFEQAGVIVKASGARIE